MANRKAQGKAGVPATRRGQQMGDARSTNAPAKQEQARAATPALRGRRKDANKFFADDSQQAVGGNSARPRSNSPSVPAAVPTGKKLGESGGEKVFKRRQAKKSKTG
ncbi:MAG: hypothetical protein QOF61_1690 [Acidobacteriota bacterium]|jgi:hypothetical protein|nr:hypothetical protein [Acidobacteriota bacterium]